MSTENNPRKQLRLFFTAPHPCSYLPDQEATTAFIDPEADVSQQTYTYLSERGYRRSGNYMYKPDCARCHACISLRIPVKKYVFNRSDKRIFKHNSDLISYTTNDISDQRFYKLYERYIAIRHSDGDMYPPSYNQYHDFLNNAFGNTFYQVFEDAEKHLKMVAVIDKLDNALSAVYTFFEPDDEKRSLGTLAILWQIEHALALGLEYVYLGYWIKQCPKMNYKTRFRPAEILINKRWLTLL